MTIEKRPVIVIGDHVQALGIVRSLGRKGLNTIIVSHVKGIAHHSKYARQYVKINNAPLQKGFRKELNNVCLKYPGAVIFPTTDDGVKSLLNFVNHDSGCIPAIPNKSAVLSSLSKLETYELASRLQIPIPIHVVDDFDSFDNYPAVIRPDDMQSFNSQYHKKMIQVNDKAELIEKMSNLKREYSKQLFIQEKIPEAHLNLYSYCAFCLDGEVIAGFVGKRLRQHPMEFGSASTLVKLVNNSIIQQSAGKLLHELNYTGVAEVEFIYDKRSNEYLLTEINPRFWKWHTLSLALGLDLPFMLYKALTGDNRTGRIIPKNANGVWYDMIADIPVLLRHGRYSRTQKKGNRQVIHAVKSRGDNLPFLVEFTLAPFLSKRGR